MTGLISTYNEGVKTGDRYCVIEFFILEFVSLHVGLSFDFLLPLMSAFTVLSSLSNELNLLWK